MHEAATHTLRRADTDAADAKALVHTFATGFYAIVHLAYLFAAIRTRFANIRANYAQRSVVLGLAQHKIRGGLANLGAIEHQA